MNRRIAVALAVLMIGVIATAGAAGAISPSIKATPYKGLFENRSIEVKGKNFAPDANLVAMQCSAGAASLDTCDEATAVLVQANAAGKFSTTTNVHHLLDTTSGAVDCSDGGCVINVGVDGNFAATATSASLQFSPPKDPKKGAITVPLSVPDGGTAVVGATGFAANAPMRAALCTVDPASPSDCQTPVAFYVNNVGAGSVTLIAPDTISTPNTPSTDCTVFGSCEYAIWDARSFFPTVVTDFHVVMPQEPGTLTVEPTDDLVDGQAISVSGTGWDAGKIVRIYQCAGLNSGSNCNNNVKVTVAGDGSFSKSYTVHPVISTGQAINCLTGPCWIVVLRLVHEIPVFASQRITFATP